jgi:hypothetical protein
MVESQSTAGTANVRGYWLWLLPEGTFGHVMIRNRANEAYPLGLLHILSECPDSSQL